LGIIDELIAQDLVIGTLAREAKECSHEGKNMAALACLFILAELTVKLALNRTKGNFYQLLETAKEKKLISHEEYSLLDNLRQIRNRFFHETHYAWSYEKGSIAHLFSEDETKKEIFDDFSNAVFQIMLRLLSQ